MRAGPDTAGDTRFLNRWQDALRAGPRGQRGGGARRAVGMDASAATTGVPAPSTGHAVHANAGHTGG